MNILITGAQSGLGKYLYEQLGGTCYTRQEDNNHFVPNQPYNAIIHCAFNQRKDDLHQYLSDNIFLTQKLVRLKCKKFIYLSSIDVYPKNQTIHTENEIIDLNDANLGLYQITKLFAENIILKHCPNHLIIRPGLLIGPYMRKNNLMKLLTEKQPILSLTENSTFNCVSYADILAFIKTALQQDITGIFNAVCNTAIKLKDLAIQLNKPVKFGIYHYQTDNISNKKIKKPCRCFDKDSLATLQKQMELADET